MEGVDDLQFPLRFVHSPPATSEEINLFYLWLALHHVSSNRSTQPHPRQSLNSCIYSLSYRIVKSPSRCGVRCVLEPSPLFYKFSLYFSRILLSSISLYLFYFSLYFIPLLLPSLLPLPPQGFLSLYFFSLSLSSPINHFYSYSLYLVDPSATFP